MTLTFAPLSGLLTTVRLVGGSYNYRFRLQRDSSVIPLPIDSRPVPLQFDRAMTILHYGLRLLRRNLNK